jgi:hypothetical protein
MFAALLVAAAALSSGASVARTDIDVYVGPPPPEPRMEVVPESRPGYVWAPGYWRWENNRHVWSKGHWEHERHGHRWEADRWDREGDRWVHRRGHWEREGGA